VSKQLVRVATGASSPRRLWVRLIPRECPRALSNEKPTTKRCLRRCDRGVSSACPSHGALSFRLNFQLQPFMGARERTPRAEVLAPRRRNHVVQTNLEASALNTSRSASPSCSSSLSSVANKSTIRVPFSICPSHRGASLCETSAHSLGTLGWLDGDRKPGQGTLAPPGNDLGRNAREVC
jgi:hypothetical protein